VRVKRGDSLAKAPSITVWLGLEYKRKNREVLSKIKKAGVIAYEKDYGASQTNGI